MNPKRNPDVIWRVEKKREAEVIEMLERGEDPGEQGTVILIVSGTMHQLNIVGGTIWQLCDGSNSIDDIVAALAEEFDVDSEELAGDVDGFVDDLVQRGWLIDG